MGKILHLMCFIYLFLLQPFSISFQLPCNARMSHNFLLPICILCIIFIKFYFHVINYNVLIFVKQWINFLKTIKKSFKFTPHMFTIDGTVNISITNYLNINISKIFLLLLCSYLCPSSTPFPTTTDLFFITKD